MGDWTQVGENLVRHRAGTIYLRAKVAGKIKRMSLDTDNLRIAKLRRDTKLDALRKAAANDDLAELRTLEDLITHVLAERKQPGLKSSTHEYYDEMAAILVGSMQVTTLGKDWRASDARLWWKAMSERYSATRANNALAMAKEVGALIVKSGMQMENPTDKLRRMPVPKKRLEVPSRQVLEKIIADIIAQKKRNADVTPFYVAFLAYSGCRHDEAANVRWTDIDADWLRVYGGDEGTKNREWRQVPLSEPLRATLDQLRTATLERAKKAGAARVPLTGKIFRIRSPRIALSNSCKRLNVPHLSLHDLRHFFATWAIESGVDIPTVSRWLGHKDGGVLAMKTYGHLRDDHSLASAKKLV